MKLRKRAFLLVLLACSIVTTRQADAQKAPILVESFSSMNCGPCKSPDGSLDAYIQSHPNVILMNVHTDNPHPSNDPFWVASKATSDYRFITFWATGANPWSFVNGVDASSDFATWKSNIESADTSYSAKISIVPSTFVDGKCPIEVQLTGVATNSVRLNVAVLEDGISYTNKEAYGGPPSGNTWNDILRTILPTPQGTPAFTFSGTKSFTVTLDTSGTGWKLANLRVVAFLEEYTNDNVATAKVVGLNQFSFASAAVALSPAHNLKLSAAIPNPFFTSSSLPIELKSASKVTVTIVNELGSEFTVIRNHEVSAGATTLPLELRGYPAGVYQARVFVNGVYAGSQKLVRIGE